MVKRGQYFQLPGIDRCHSGYFAIAASFSSAQQGSIASSSSHAGSMVTALIVHRIHLQDLQSDRI